MGTALREQIAQVLQLDSPILNFIEQQNGWYVIQRESDPTSTRYNLTLKKRGFDYNVLLHDFKLDKNYTIRLTNKPKELKLSTTESKPIETPLIHKETEELYESGEMKEHNYLVKKKLTKLNVEGSAVRVVRHFGQSLLMVPFTNFALYPRFTGAKLIAADGQKLSVKGSSFKGSFHAHRYMAERSNFILGEGFSECFIASTLFDNFNILEVGSVSNMPVIINEILTKNPSSTIYVMGEHGSEDLYEKIATKNPNVRVSYPPDKNTKDFGDYYESYGLSKTKEAILGLSLEQNLLGYKPLGIEAGEPVFYSKVINEIVKRPMHQIDSIFRLSTKNPHISHLAPKKAKEAALSALFLECAELGSYSPDKTLPIGLWKYKNPDINKYQFYYNDGSKVLRIKKDTLQIFSYSSIIKSDFLLYRVPNKTPIDIHSDFEAYKELTELMEGCDWLRPFYGKLFLGFLVQSFYAGSIDFRPHLWIKSKESHAGKTWLSTWAAENLVQNAFIREAGRSTLAGTAQSMSKLAGLLIADEFAEKDTIYMTEATKMIELLRSAATANFPIVLGSPNQVPILGHCRFSALLACIHGVKLLQKQDYDRIVFLEFGEKRGNFVKDLQPKFEQFVLKEKHKGFASYCLLGFPYYISILNKYHVMLGEKFPDIGHKVRGLASILAGYAVLQKSEKELPDLIDKIEDSSIVEPFNEIIGIEDIIERILRMLIQEKYVFAGETTFKTLLQLLKANASHEILSLGIRLEGFKLKLYASEFNNFNEKYLKLSKLYLYQELKNSKYFVKHSNSHFNGKKTRYFLFDLESYMMNKERHEI